MTDQSFLHSASGFVSGAEGTAGYTLQNFMGAAFLGIWIIFSNIAAPVIIGKSISEGFSVGSALMKGAASAGHSASATAATVGLSVASGGGVVAAASGLVAGTSAGLESLVTSSTDAGGGSLIIQPADQIRETRSHLKRRLRLSKLRSSRLENAVE